MGASRRFGVVLTLIALAGSAAPARAQHGSWLLEYLSGWYSDPGMINARQPTTITLWGWFPYQCGQVTDARVVDSAHVELTLRPGRPLCADTVAVWHQPFQLGLLPSGYNRLNVRRLFYDVGVDTPSVAEGSFLFYVEQDSVPPPPPPDCIDHSSLFMRGISRYGFEPELPNTQVPTTLVLYGWFPYRCGQVSGQTISPTHVRVSLSKGPACADTVVTWTQRFDLGLLPPGMYAVDVEMHVASDSCDTTRVRTARLDFPVSGDVVSTSVPNPFVEETRFFVSASETGPVDVGIYDLTGRRVTTLFLGELPAGTHELRWNGRRADGSDAPVGIYFSRVAMANRVVTRRLVMIPRR